MTKKRITILGGGNGSTLSIRALKSYADFYDLSAVIAMTDSGSSSGVLRKEFGVLPPGDLLRALIAMSSFDYETLKAVFYRHRYEKHGRLKGFGLGHLLLAFLEQYNGSVIDAIRPVASAFAVVGPVFPVTTAKSDLEVVLENGEVITGEHEIDRPAQRDVLIKEARLQPSVVAHDKAVQAILDSEVIVIGPGSFYTSIIATLLPEGIKEALAKTSAKIVYVAGGAIEGNGEAGPTTLQGFLESLHRYIDRPVDVVIFNNPNRTEAQQQRYQEERWIPIVDDIEGDYRYTFAVKPTGPTAEEATVLDANGSAEPIAADVNINTTQKQIPIIRCSYEKEEGGLDHYLLGEALHNWIQNYVS